MRAYRPDPVADRLYAGAAPLTAEDVDALAELGVTDILDLRESWEWEGQAAAAVDAATARALRRHHLPLTDGTAPDHQFLDDVVERIEMVLQVETNVLLVHCRAGMERTGLVLVAWLASRMDLTYAEALRILRQGRQILDPLPGQEEAVRDWLNRR